MVLGFIRVRGTVLRGGRGDRGFEVYNIGLGLMNPPVQARVVTSWLADFVVDLLHEEPYCNDEGLMLLGQCMQLACKC